MTLHLTDIKSALEGGHISDIEDAFRALVGWPNEEEIIGVDANTRCTLLGAVCDSLRGDDRLMPADIVTIIEDAGGLRGGTYQNGADAVLSDLEYWRSQVRIEA
jgi:hypothetical protein